MNKLLDTLKQVGVGVMALGVLVFYIERTSEADKASKERIVELVEHLVNQCAPIETAEKKDD